MVQASLSPAVLAYKPPHPALEEHTPARDRALFADPNKTSLLTQASAFEDLTPYIGTEVKGIQLSALTSAQKDELALLVAEVQTNQQILHIRPLMTEERCCVLPRPRHYT